MKKDIIEQIYHKYHRAVFLYAFSLCQNRHDAEDLVSESFVKAFLSYKEGSGNIKNWLLVVLKNQFINEYKKKKRIVNYPIEIIENPYDALNHWNEKNIPSYEYRFVLTNNQMTGEHMGFSFTGIDGYSYIETMEETPSYHISGFEGNTSNDFYEYYKTRLMTLLKHENFLKALDFRSEKTHKVLIEEELERIEKKELEVKGYLAHVSKEEMLEILNDVNTFYVKIEDAKYSIYEK